MRHQRLSVCKGFVLACLSLAALYLFIHAPVIFEQAYLALQLQRFGAYGVVLFIGGFAASHALGFPGNVLTIMGGALFGIVWGTVFSLIAATLGAVGAFLLARTLLHQWIEHRFGHYPLLQKLHQAIAHRPLNFVLAVRLNPLSPFSLVNFLFGLTPVTLTHYTVGTAIGIIPGTFAYAWIGASGKQALSGSDRVSLYFALSFLALLSLLPMLRKQP
jgi:uncharacterized membrane protein YdjX (TVP38/TMEM64 family)